MPVGEMTITLDDVACPGRLIQEVNLDPDHGVELMVTHLLFLVEDAVEQVILPVSRRFCCSCLATLFLPARTAKLLICCGCLRFGIWLT